MFPLFVTSGSNGLLYINAMKRVLITAGIAILCLQIFGMLSDWRFRIDWAANYAGGALLMVVGLILIFIPKWRWLGQGLLLAGAICFCIGYAICSGMVLPRRGIRHH
jgi:hypothetical protein